MSGARDHRAAVGGVDDAGAFPVHMAENVFSNPNAPALAYAGDFDSLPDHPPHTHDFIKIVVVSGGHATHHGANGTTELQPGSVMVIRPGAWHAFGERRGLVAACLGISPPTLVSDLSLLRLRARTRDLLKTGPSAVAAQGIWSSNIPPAAAKIVLEETTAFSRFIDLNPDDDLRIVGRLIAVLGGLADALPNSRQPSHSAVIAAMNHLETAPQRQWTTTELARLVNLQRTYLIRLFGAQAGVPPMTYLAHVRAERAASMLATTDLPISTIAAMVGWPDPAYFARRFRGLVGASPSDYRRGLRSLPHAV